MSYKQPHTFKSFKLFIRLAICLLALLPLAARANTTTTNEAGFTLYADDEPIEVKKITITNPNTNNPSTATKNIFNEAIKFFTLTPTDSKSQSQTITINTKQTEQPSLATININEINQQEVVCDDDACFIEENKITEESPNKVEINKANDEINRPLPEKENVADVSTQIPAQTFNKNEKVQESVLNKNVSPANFNLAEQPKEIEPELQPSAIEQEDFTVSESAGQINEQNESEKKEPAVYETKEEPIQRIFRKINSFFKRVFSFFGRK